MLCHLSSRGAIVSAYNDDVPASFLRDVAAYIVRCQSVKTLKRRSLSLKKFSWLGRIALEISQRCCRSGLWQPSVSIMNASSLSGTFLSSPGYCGHFKNQVQVLPESHPAPLNMQRRPKCACTKAVSPENICRAEVCCQPGSKRNQTSCMARETSAAPSLKQAVKAAGKELVVMAQSATGCTLALFMKPHTFSLWPQI